ncbi:MAG: hypothetical protein H0T75_10285 [Rhizobiales bacterium]|jgi:hypothetical protein|nr:hypothetical protein [Hyphomicrobiales bacterium]MDQ3559038.1 hypothetical protein [Pseudomonadota bacterium]
MYMSNSELHLLRARIASDSELAMGEYLKAIEEAVKELKTARPTARAVQRR